MTNDSYPDYDAVRVTSVNEDGSANLVRSRPGQPPEISVGRRAEEGKPIQGNLMMVGAMGEDGWAPVKSDFKAPSPPSPSPAKARTVSGPALVNSTAFKAGWTNIFGKQSIGNA